MSNDTETARYYVRGTDPTNDEQIAFECVGLAVANAKAAELRMGGYRDVILSLANAPEAREGGRPDISRADYTFCLLAIDWGWGIEETAARLLQESGAAEARGSPRERVGRARRVEILNWA